MSQCRFCRHYRWYFPGLVPFTTTGGTPVLSSDAVMLRALHRCTGDTCRGVDYATLAAAVGVLLSAAKAVCTRLAEDALVLQLDTETVWLTHRGRLWLAAYAPDSPQSAPIRR